MANHASYRTEATSPIVAEQISRRQKIGRTGKDTGSVHAEPLVTCLSIIALVEVRLLWVGTAWALDDDIGGVATSRHAVLDALALDQPREKASDESVT